jgi:hypothetical protein
MALKDQMMKKAEQSSVESLEKIILAGGKDGFGN